MTTKDGLCFLKKDKQKPFVNGNFSNSVNDAKKYSNFNLNQASKNGSDTSSFVPFQSKSKINEKFDPPATHNYNETVNSQTYAKRSSIGLHRRHKPFNYFSEEKSKNQQWKKNDNINSSSHISNSSTLSLHISAYENSTASFPEEVTTTADLCDENKMVQMQSSARKQKKNAKQIFNDFMSSAAQSSFEFSRQQEDTTSEPEISQFKASQKLLNPNQSDTELKHKKGHRVCGTQCDKEDILRDLDADKLLSEFGPWGKFQMLGYYLCVALTFFVSTSLFVMQFIQAMPDKECTLNEQRLTDYYVSTDDEKACKINMNGKEFDCGEQGTKLEVQGYPNAQSISSYFKDFDIGCSHYIVREAGLSVFTIAAILCVPVVSHLSDVYGRKPLLMISVFVAMVASFLCSLSPNYWTFLILRFIVGGATDAYATISSILSCELVSQDSRSWVGLVYTMAWVAGYLYVGLLSSFRLSWRYFYALTTFPMLISLIYFFWIPESPHWLASHKKYCQLRKYVDDSVHFNNRGVNLSACLIASQRQRARKHAEGSDGQYKRAFKKPFFIFYILINGYIQFTTQMYYFALTLSSLTLSEDKFLGYMLSGFIEIPGGLIVIPLMKYFGRKTLIISALFLQGLFIIGYPYLHGNDYIWPAITLNLLGKLANGIIQVVHPIIVTEMLPTKMRTMIYSVVNIPQSIGILLAPYLKYTSGGYAPTQYLILAGLSFLGMAFSFLLPETKGKNLPEDVEEMDHGPMGRCLGLQKKKKKKVIAEKK